jgi:hypothetical protein
MRVGGICCWVMLRSDVETTVMVRSSIFVAAEQVPRKMIGAGESEENEPVAKLAASHITMYIVRIVPLKPKTISQLL